METLSKEIYLIGGITVFAIMMTAFILVIISAHQQKQRKYGLEKAALKAQYQESLLQSQLEIQEQTLKNISQEIHDNIGQTLSLAKLNLNTLKLNDPENAVVKIASSKELVSKAILDLRSLSKTMHTDTILQAGLLKALEIELQIISRSSDIHTALKVAGTPFSLDPQKELIIFRTIQEAFNNVIKHANAQSINIEVIYADNKMEITVADNGSGFDPNVSKPEKVGGSGLRNMKNRMQLIGASLNIHANDPKGTKVHIIIPK